VYVPDSGLVSCEYPGGQVLHRWPHMQLQVSRAINFVMSLVDSSDVCMLQVSRAINLVMSLVADSSDFCILQVLAFLCYQ
jgi:hypothetical protein